jgi:hypothetical protein
VSIDRAETGDGKRNCVLHTFKVSEDGTLGSRGTAWKDNRLLHTSTKTRVNP